MDDRIRRTLEAVRSKLEGVDQLTDAVAQLEQQHAKLDADVMSVARKMAQNKFEGVANRSGAPGDRSYRGVFGSDDDARAFALYCLSSAHAFNPDIAGRAGDMLKNDYPDIATRAMDSVGDGALTGIGFSSRMVRLVERHGVFERNAFVMPMEDATLTFMRRTGGITVFLVGENTAGTGSEPTYGNVTLNAKEWGTLTYAPITLEEDSLPMLGELIAEEIIYAFAKKTDDCGFVGDASATYFGITGVVAKLKGLSDTVANIAGLQVASGNLWSEITDDDFYAMVGKCPDYALDNAKFYCSHQFYFQVIVPIILGSGGVTAFEMEGERGLRFMGWPVELTNSMPKTQANSQVPCLFGDLTAAATVGRRRGPEVGASRDYKFAERQITYLGTCRKAINVHEVGNASATASEREAGPIVGLITAAS